MSPTLCLFSRSLLRASAVALSAGLVFPLGYVHADDGTWNKTTSGLLWSTAANWSGSTVADGSGFTANFNTLDTTVNPTIVNLDSARTIGNLIFGDTNTTTAGGWTLGNSSNPLNILTLAGTTPTVTVNALNSSSLVTISAVIAGTSGLTKNGTGTTTTGILALSGANTYSGGTTISTGTIRAQNNTALGTGAATVASGARLQISGGVNVGNTINLNGSTALFGNTGANTLSGTVNLQSASTLAMNSANDNNLTFSGAVNLSGNTLTVSTVGNTNSFVTIAGTINGAGGITKTGSGILTINNDQISTYSGTTTLSLGTLAIGSDGALGTGGFTFGANDNPVTMRSSGTAARTLANTLTLAGNSGTNAIYNFGSTVSSVNGDLTFSSTGNISMGSLSRKFSVNNTTRFNGGFTGTAGITQQTGTGTLVLNGTNTYTGATTINAGTFQLGNGGSTGSLSTTSTITVASGATFAVNRSNAVTQGTDFKTVISGAGNFTQAGGGTTTMASGNTYTGTTTISAGTLALGASNAFADASNFVMSGGTLAAGTFSDTLGTLSLTGNASIILGSGGAFAFADSDAISWGSNTLSITGTFVDGASIRFGTDATGLTGEQLALISINGIFGASIDSSGFLSAIPEPSTYAMLSGGVFLGLALLRRRRS